MKPDRVVHLRSPRPFASASDETLWSTEAWYTLNSYPGYVETDPEPAPDGIYELEDGELTGTAGIDTEHAGYTGSGFVDGIQTVGSGTTVEVVAPKAGTYDLQIRYANGPNPQPNQTKKMSLYIGDERQEILLPPFADWKTWGTYTARVTLPAGVTRVGIVYEQGDDGNVNLDHVKVVDPTGGRVEAEDGTVTGQRNRVQTEHAGYSGTGYVGGFENDGAAVTFDVTATTAGFHAVKLGYANGPNPQPNQTKVHVGLRQRRLRQEAVAAADRHVEGLGHASRTSSSCRPAPTSSRSSATPVTTATSTSTTSTSVPARPARRARRRVPTTSSTAPRSTPAGGARSSTRRRPASRWPTASCASTRSPATCPAVRSTRRTWSCRTRPPTAPGPPRRSSR